MAGAGYKLFTTGDVLTAAQVNTYLNEQTVMVFADSAARTTAFSYLQDTNAVEVYNSTAWVGLAADQTPLTTKGDLFGFSTVDARIPVGTNGHVLTADSTETLGVKWAAPSAGALTLVSATTFSSVASHSVDSVFTSSYKYYRALLVFTASGINTMTLRWRASSSDNTGNTYYAVTRSTDSAGTSEYASTVPGTASAFLGKYNSDFNSVSFDIFDPQVASKTLFTGTAFSRGSSAGGLAAVNFGGGFDGTNAFDGMTLIASSGTITGTLKIYGYQN
jgi:hypothetical protein